MRGGDFATTLQDARRVIGRQHDGYWQIHVYSPDGSRLLGYGSAPTRPRALASAGLNGKDADEVLSRIGI